MRPLVVDVPAVLVSGKVARQLAGPLAGLLARARANGERLDEDLVATVAALEEAGRRYAVDRVQAGLRSAGGTAVDAGRTAVATMTAMDTTETAAALGCSERNVRALAKRGTLPGRQAGSRWLFDRAAVDDLARRRSAS